MISGEKAMATLDDIEQGEEDVTFNELLELAMYLSSESTDKRLAMLVLALTRKLIVLNHRLNKTRDIAESCRMWHK